MPINALTSLTHVGEGRDLIASHFLSSGFIPCEPIIKP